MKFHYYRHPFQVRVDLGSWRFGLITNPRRWAGFYLGPRYLELKWIEKKVFWS